MIFDGTILSGDNMPLLSSRTFVTTAIAGTATVSITFRSDGVLEVQDQIGTRIVSDQEWWSGGSQPAVGNNYDVRCSQIISGQAFTSEAASVGAAIDISANRSWSVQSDQRPGLAVTGIFQILPTGTSEVLAEGQITLIASVETFL